MGRAKRRQPPDVGALRRPVDEEPPHPDHVAEAMLDMALDYDEGNPLAGIRNAIIAGVAFWTLLAFVALLLV